MFPTSDSEINLSIKLQNFKVNLSFSFMNSQISEVLLYNTN
jgi:hypothetical protein